MKRAVFDASVAAKWIFNEVGSNESIALLQAIELIYEPALFPIEVDAIITKKARKREITLEEAQIKKEQIDILPYQPIAYKEVSEMAFDLSLNLPITLYDATYVVTAIYTNSIFYSADERLVRGLKTTRLSKFVASIYEG